jgi:hypothetical protein
MITKPELFQQPHGVPIFIKALAAGHTGGITQ